MNRTESLRKWHINRARMHQCAFMAALILLGLLLFRPHEDTFTALDHSGYRLMAYAFTQGRGFHEVDHVLAEVPPRVRQSLMLLPHMHERNTRDRSFTIFNLEDPTTEPFFYPLLPWLAAQADRLLPGRGLDSVVPFFGLLFCGVLLFIGLRFGGVWGVLVASVLILGTPLPMWLFRGFYVEAVGAACLMVAALIYLRGDTGKRWALGAGLMAGMAVSFHPVYIVPALPLVIMLALDTERQWRAGMAVCVGFAVGFSILLAMTQWICSPYGDFSFSSLLFSYRASASHRLPHLFALGSVSFWGVALATKPWWQQWLALFYSHIGFRLVLVALAMGPLFFATFIWPHADLVRQGLREGMAAVRLPLGLLLGAGAVGVVCSKRSGRAFSIWLIFLFTLPMFAYLKGAEQMGMWSQRRLLPAYTLLALAVLPWLAGMVRKVITAQRGRLGLVLSTVTLLYLAMAGFANILRWPAPYLTRVEAGGLPFVESVKAVMGDRLVMFDYHPFSFPFAVDNRTRVAGLGQYRPDRLDRVAAWMAEMAQLEEVWWASAYRNPGLEDGVVLEPVSTHTAQLARIISRAALPAEERPFDITLSLLRARPLDTASPGVVQDKVLDGGPLGLRGPWGRYRRSLLDESGQHVPADWSRQGSGIIGPIPAAGETAHIQIWGQSGQAREQEVHVLTPWGETAVIRVGSDYGLYEARVERSVPSTDEADRFTGTYRVSSPTPYDPAQEGIRGFASDLGILIHRIRIIS